MQPIFKRLTSIEIGYSTTSPGFLEVTSAGIDKSYDKLHKIIDQGHKNLPNLRLSSESETSEQLNNQLTNDSDEVNKITELSINALLDQEKHIKTLEIQPTNDILGNLLINTNIATGFRKYLAELSSSAYPYGSLIHQLLDDLPTGSIIASYVYFRQFTKALNQIPEDVKSNILDKLTDSCAGWEKTGHAVKQVSKSLPIPVKISGKLNRDELDDDNPYSNKYLNPNWMRRYRRIEILKDLDLLYINASFHDTFSNPQSEEITLQGYLIKISVKPFNNYEIVQTEIIKSYLPFNECQNAYKSLDQLEKTSVFELQEKATTLKGTAGCLHLNDLLRSVGFLMNYLNYLYILE